MASALQSLETQLNEMLVTNAPVQLPANWRKWLATYAWVFALIGFVFGLFSVLVLLPVLGFVSIIGSAVIGTGVYLFFAWLSFLVLAGYVVLLGVAMPKLKRLEKGGWNLIFYSSLFFMVYDVFSALQRFSFGSFLGLIWNLAIGVVGLYFIFQVRSHFLGKKSAAQPKKS